MFLANTNTLTHQATTGSNSHVTYAHLEKALNDCTHVFIRNPTNKPPLSPSYDGPFRVLSKHDKYYTVDLVTRVDNVSIDRVKAAHLLRPGHEEAQTFHSQQPAPLTSATPFPINIPSPPSSPKTTRRDEQPAEVVINRFGRQIVGYDHADFKMHNFRVSRVFSESYTTHKHTHTRPDTPVPGSPAFWPFITIGPFFERLVLFGAF